MNWVLWAPVISAGVSVAGAIAAVIGWLKARGERKEAARQAKASADAAVESEKHLRSIAQVQIEQHQAAAVQVADEEIEPWTVDDDTTRGGMILRNLTGRSKYGIRLAGQTVLDSDHFEFIGPYGQKPFDAFRIGNGPVDVEITWHLQEDFGDEQRFQRYDLG